MSKDNIKTGTLLSWSSFNSTVPLSGRTGVGPGEDRLADILGGEVQGQSESFDLSIASGPFAGRWEIKAPDNSREIRPGTEGITAFGPIQKVLRNTFDELAEFLSFPGISELAAASNSSELYDKISSFSTGKKSEKSKTNIELITAGEITAARFEEIMKVIEAVSELIKKMQGDLLNITVDDQEFQVTPANMLRISRLLGMSDDDASGGLGDAADAAIALSSLNSPVFKNPSSLRQQWEETVSADEVFNLTGVILVTPEGFMMLPYPYGDSIKFSRVTQGKPKFKTPLKGKSGSGIWESTQQHDLLRSLVRESIIIEELTKSDKKEIDKLIKKAIEKDRAEQKKLIRKEIEDELVKSLGKSFFRQPGRIRKTIIDVCQEELSKEMQKGSKMEKSVVDVTKKVMTAWHEMLYKQKHIVDRIKV